MQKFTKEFQTVKKTALESLGILAIIVAAIWLYLYYTSYYVIIRFDELGSITKNMSAYYNGFKIGKIVSIKPDSDFKHTHARVNLLYKDLRLPQNTTVRVQSFPNGELYLEFIYPQSPSLKTIKRGDILEGIAKYSLEEFMLGQSISGVSDLVSYHVIKTLNATEIANHEIKMFFENSSNLVQENRQEISASIKNINIMTKNFAQMAKNLNQTSEKLNNSINEDDLKKTTSNIKDTSENIAKATTDIDKTVKKIDETISQAQAAAENLNSITSGVNGTLSKRFGGMRVMFGKPVSPRNNAVRNCCK